MLVDLVGIGQAYASTEYIVATWFVGFLIGVVIGLTQVHILGSKYLDSDETYLVSELRKLYMTVFIPIILILLVWTVVTIGFVNKNQQLNQTYAYFVNSQMENYTGSVLNEDSSIELCEKLSKYDSELNVQNSKLVSLGKPEVGYLTYTYKNVMGKNKKLYDIVLHVRKVGVDSFHVDVVN